jgi:hypothetical protein
MAGLAGYYRFPWAGRRHRDSLTSLRGSNRHAAEMPSWLSDSAPAADFTKVRRTPCYRIQQSRRSRGMMISPTVTGMMPHRSDAKILRDAFASLRISSADSLVPIARTPVSGDTVTDAMK